MPGDLAAPAFTGAKAAFFQGGRLLTYLRDDFPGLPWPGMWDLPGGGREGDESAETCLLRELEEEFGLRLSPDRLIWRQPVPAATGNGLAVFFAGRLTPQEIAAIRFGPEGQHWQMMPVPTFLAHPLAIEPLCRRVRDVLQAPDFAAEATLSALGRASAGISPVAR